MIAICWYVQSNNNYKFCEKNPLGTGTCLFSMIVSILAPLVALSTVMYLFPPPNSLILSSSYYPILCVYCWYMCWVSAIKICEKNHWDFLVYWIPTIFPLIFSNRGSDFGVLGHLWSQNDVIMSWLSLTATSNYSPIHLRHFQSVWAHW